MSHYLYRAVVVAVLVFLGGWLGFKMAVPPGYASPLWPPAGIALAALMLDGRSRLWPAIWLGGFATNVLAGVDFGEGFSLAVLLSAAIIGLGSTLQALAAAWLSKKFIHSGIPALDNPRQVLSFFLLTGPLACLIAPSIGISSLFLLNLMPQAQLLVSWVNWWIGDGLGVILLAPLSFCLFAEPRKLWGPRISRVALPLLLTLLTLAPIFLSAFRAEEDRIQLMFNSQAATVERLVREYVNNALDSTQATKDLFVVSDQVTRDEFAQFAMGMIDRHPQIQALEWLPKVTGAELPGFEQRVRGQGFSEFKVTERMADGSLQPATARDEYFPILFVEPMAGNEQVLGLDSSSHPASQESKAWARVHGKPSVSKGLRLAQRVDEDFGVLLSIPVYGKTDLRDVNPAHLQGFISAVLLPAQIINSAMQGRDRGLFGATLRDLSASTAQGEILFSRGVAHPLLASDGLKNWRSSFPFCDRTWEVEVIADRQFMREYGSILPWATLFGSLCFTGLLTVFLLTITGRTAHAEALVSARTAELEKANGELNALANHLRASEVKLRTLIQSQPECVKLLARNGALLDMNQAGLKLIDAENLEQVKGQDISHLVLSKYRPAFVESVRKVFAGESVALEFEIQSLKGTRRWLDTQAVPLRDSDGNIIALLGMTRDITKRKQMETALRENEQKLSNILNNVSAYVYLKDKQGRYLYANRMVCELWGVKEDDVIGFGDEKFFDAESTAKVRANDDRVLIHGETLKIEETNLVQKTGQIQTYWSTKLPLYDEQGEIYALLGISTDITERKHAEENLKLAARVFGEAHEGILITDADGNIIDVNPMFCEITGYSRDEVLGKNPNLLKSGKHGAEFYQDMWHDLIHARHWQGEIWNRKKNGDLYAELLTISALCDDQGDILYFVGLFSDITESKEQQQMLEMMAHYDPLTRLPNRTLFTDRLLQAIARSRREKSLLAICFLDLDGFKPVNDQFGHDAGDRVLIEVAERIKSSVREQDSVSRHGGDEFALLLGGLRSVEECELAIGRIHRAIAEPYAINGQTVNIGVSSGITLFPLDDADSDTLLRHADHAMYQAKLAGKNRYQLFDASQDQQAMDRNKQLREIEAAFNDHQFCLFYQPKVNIKTGEIMGVEALIRWQHPERGLVPPLAFLPAIASNELEIRIGNWVIETAWQQLVAWHRQGLKLQVSVNISSYHLLWTGFVAYLETVMATAADIDACNLQLEILESTALDDLNAINRVVKLCRDSLGISTALDDFGTGYSSLTHLRHLPVDTVKIDKSFVRDMLDDPDDYAIVESVLGLSHAFSRDVVAEGVENQEQGSVLLMLGCQLAQGYAIAKPMPAGDLPAWAGNYRPYPDWLFHASLDLAAEQLQIAIRRIDLAQWLQGVSRCLNANHGYVNHWPIMVPAKTHFGRWVSQARQRQQYDEHWLLKLAVLHKELLAKGSILMHQFWEGDVDGARAGFAELQMLQQEIDQYLTEYA